jgi:hypothetical protein
LSAWTVTAWLAADPDDDVVVAGQVNAGEGRK